ncbi:hypothetical protein GE09DRAFT_977947 [Coniochaeta sp. 2T2.1]|nr:hypothetical protein GE09DRAFT_977947 [Coniochaeta sp. 2T2.1]
MAPLYQLVYPLLLNLMVAAASAIPLDVVKCTVPEKRQSWHDIPSTQKAAYLAAQTCILKSPQKLNRLPGAKTRWDELVALHQLLALQIHTTGNFLPYHRYFLNIQKSLLQECGYNDTLPYWDETRDAGKFSASPVFDATTGFGGSGAGTSSCLVNGPFVNFTVNIGPGFTTQPRYVNRKITDFLSTQTGTSYVNAALSKTTYAEVLDAIYSGPHLYGHMALSMMNGDSITSPGDPLFIMHHGFVDKMWATWQSKDPSTRHKEIGGLNAQDPALGFSEFPGGQEEESKMWGKPTAQMLAVTPDPQLGDGGKNMTLGHVLSSLGIIPNVTVADIMDTKGGYLCYEYV